MRKLASIFLALLMVFLCIPSSTVSAETTSTLKRITHSHLVTLGYTFGYTLKTKCENSFLFVVFCVVLGFESRLAL